MEFVTILYNMHVQETINNPLTHIEINIENVKMISTENELKNALAKIKIFEKKFAKLIGTKYAVGVNSGTDAIKLSLKAIGIKHGDEIITAANTFVATVGAICELGAKPVFVDCDDSFCMDINLIEKKNTNKTLLEKGFIYD